MGLAGCGADEPPAPPEPPRSVVVISLDTVRQDRLSAYGFSRPTSPHLEELASASVVLTHAFTSHTNTGPSHATMLTGLYPHAHGSLENGQPIDPRATTLAEILREVGFRTAAFLSSSTLKPDASGLDAGFEVYECGFAGRRRDGARTVTLALEWLGLQPEDARFLLFVHLYDAHGPYEPPREYASLFRSPRPGPQLRFVQSYQRGRLGDAASLDLHDYVDRYDGLLRYLDDVTRPLIAAIDTESTALVVLADHGETLGERYHTLDHGGQVFEEQILIPWIVRSPGHAPAVRPEIVETVDLMPTLLGLLGVPEPSTLDLHGRDLAPLLRGDGGGRKHAFSSAVAKSVRHADRGYRLDESRQIHAVRGRRWKLIRYPAAHGDDYLELYDLLADPGETSDLAAENTAVVAELSAELDRWLALRRDTAESPELSPELREELEALGYLQ